MRRSGAEKPAHRPAGEVAPRQRLDLWIWHARFLRSRKDCAALVQAGFVRLNAMRVVQPGHAVKVGDILTLALPGRTLIIEVVAFAERRGDPAAGQALYRQVDAQN
jgi:ribosome-associated heat shock protein Hsp15